MSFDYSRSKDAKIPPAPSNDWLSRQEAEQIRMIREPKKSKTIPEFYPYKTPIKRRRK